MVFFDGPPGVGKSLLFDVVRQLLNRRCVYVAPHIILQEQVSADFPEFALLMGKANYHRGDDESGRHFPSRSCADCVRRKYCAQGGCAYQDAKNEFLGAQVGILNSSYWLAAAIHLGMFDRLATSRPPLGGSGWRAVGLARVDDDYEWAARDAEGNSIPLDRLTDDPDHCDRCHSRRERALLVVAENEEGERIQLGSSCLKKQQVWMPPALATAMRSLAGGWNGDHLTVFDEADTLERQLLDFLEVRLSAKVAGSLDIPPPPRRNMQDRWPVWLQRKVIPALTEAEIAAKNRLSAAATPEAVKDWTTLNRVLQGAQRVREDWIYSPDRQGLGASFKPIRVSDFGAQELWPKALPVLFMSASIMDPARLAADLGVDHLKWAAFRAPCDWDPRRRPIYRVRMVDVVKRAEEKPAYGNGKFKRGRRHDNGWADQACFERLVAGVLWVARRHPHERTLVHTQSYDLSGALQQALEYELEDRLHAYYSSETKQAAIDAYLETPGGVILASSMVRGWNGAGDACQNIVLAKFPWGNLGDRQIKARAFQDWKWYRICAARDTLQALGRGNRFRQDWCRIYILDQQFMRIWKDPEERAWFPDWMQACVRPVGDLRDTVAEALAEETQQVRIETCLRLLAQNPLIQPEALAGILGV